MKFLDFYTHVYHNRIGDTFFEPNDICFDAYQNAALAPLFDGFVPRAGSPVIETSEKIPVLFSSYTGKSPV
jgi:hypothetical protein